jgi:hypothetical protein
MRPRVLAASLVATGLAIAACFNDRAPTAPQTIDPSKANWVLNTNGCVDGPDLDDVSDLDLEGVVNPQVSTLILQLFEGSHEASTASMWENIKKDKVEGKPIQNHIDNLASWTLEKLGAEVLQDPIGEFANLTPTTGAVRLLDLVFDCTGVTPTQLPEPPADFDAAWELVNPSQSFQQFTTNVGDAGAHIPADGLDDKTLLVLVRQRPEEAQVNTPFPKLSHIIDVAMAGGQLKAGKKLSLEFCPLDPNLPDAVNDRAVLAHQYKAPAPNTPGDGVRYFGPKENLGGIVDCHALNETAMWESEKGFFRQRALQLAWYAKKALRTVTPRKLYAAHAAIGGSDEFLDGFSPIVAVDPYLVTEVEITSVTPGVIYGDQVGVRARLHIKDVPENPAPYRNTYVNPDVVYTAIANTPVVNQTQTTNTNLPLGFAVDGGTRFVVPTDDVNSAAGRAFPCLNAGPHSVTVDFVETYVTANAPVYGASTASQSFTVAPRDLQVTPNSGQRRTYGDAIEPPDLTGTITGVQTACDSPSNIQADYVTTATSSSDVIPSGYPITVGAVTFTAPALESNYNVIRGSSTLMIDPRPINFTMVQPASRQYGEPNAPPALAGGYDNSQLRNDDALTFDWNVPTAGPTAAAGTVHAIEVTFGGEKIGNYAVTLVPANPVLSITKRILTGAAEPATRRYGDPNPEFTGTLNNTTLCCDASDGLTYTWVSDATPATDAGLYGPETANAIRLVLGAGFDANYDISAVARATLTIERRDLRIGILSASRQYGDPDPAFSFASGAVNGDQATFVMAYSTAPLSSDVGTYPITATVTGPRLSNYNLLGINPGQLTITPAPLSIAVVTPATYANGADPCQVTYTGFKLSQTPASLTGALQCSAGGSPLANPAPAGTYSIAPGGLTSTNYAISFVPGEVTVSPPDGVAATGMIIVSADQFNDGETFTLNDGVNPPVTFEFDNNSDVGAGRVSVVFTNTSTYIEIRDAIIFAINGAPIAISASRTSIDGLIIGLTHDTPGALGNQAATESVIDRGFFIIGMAGGSDTPASPPSNTAATGFIVAISAVAISDGETFTVNGRVFEFTKNEEVTAGNIGVQIDGLTTLQVQLAIVNAINAAAIGITAAEGGGTMIALTATAVGSAGNVLITETVADARFAVQGMSGGAN